VKLAPQLYTMNSMKKSPSMKEQEKRVVPYGQGNIINPPHFRGKVQFLPCTATLINKPSIDWNERALIKKRALRANKHPHLKHGNFTAIYARLNPLTGRIFTFSKAPSILKLYILRRIFGRAKTCPATHKVVVD
jgi:hypothetical protein